MLKRLQKISSSSLSSTTRKSLTQLAPHVEVCFLSNFSEGQCLKGAHFFLKAVKLLLSKAIRFSFSMECKSVA